MSRPVRTAGLLLALALAAGGAPGDEDAKNLQLLVAAGIKVRVKTALEVETAAKKPAGGGPAVAPPDVKFECEYVDEGIDDTTRRRTYVKQTALAGKGKPQPQALQGVELGFTRSQEDLAITAAKGELSEDLKSTLRNGSLDPIEILISREPMRKGSTWTVSHQVLAQFRRVLCAGWRPEGETSPDPWFLLAGGVGRLADLKLTATLQGTSGPVWVMTWVGKAESPPPKKGEATARWRIEIKAAAKIEAERGIPINLVWEELIEHQPAAGATEGLPDLRLTVKVRRDYRPEK